MLSLLHGPTLTAVHMTTVKIIAFIIQTFAGKVTPSLFNTLSRFVIAFLPRSNCHHHPVILELEKRQPVPASTFPTSIFHEVMGLDAVTLVSFMFSFKLAL